MAAPFRFLCVAIAAVACVCSTALSAPDVLVSVKASELGAMKEANNQLKEALELQALQIELQKEEIDGLNSKLDSMCGLVHKT
jgi:hypothetical protein